MWTQPQARQTSLQTSKILSHAYHLERIHPANRLQHISQLCAIQAQQLVHTVNCCLQLLQLVFTDGLVLQIPVDHLDQQCNGVLAVALTPLALPVVLI